MAFQTVSEADLVSLQKSIPLDSKTRLDDFSDMFVDKNSHIFRCARDLSAWFGHFLDCLDITRQNETYNLTALNRGFAGVVNGLYGINIIPDMNKIYHALCEFSGRVWHYKDGTKDQSTSSDIAEAFRVLTNKVCSFISDTCAFTKWVISIDALPAGVPYGNSLSIAKNTACIIRSFDNTATHGSKGYSLATQEGELTSLQALKLSHAKWEVVKEVGSIAINTLGLIGIVTSLTIASPVFLTISSVILVASTMTYFIKKDKDRMESDELMHRLTAASIQVG